MLQSGWFAQLTFPRAGAASAWAQVDGFSSQQRWLWSWGRLGRGCCVEQRWAEPPKEGKILDNRHSFCCSSSFPFHECPCWFLDTQKPFQSWKLLSLWEHLAPVACSLQPCPAAAPGVLCDTQDSHTAAKSLTPTCFYRQSKNKSKARGTLYEFHNALPSNTASCSLSSWAKSFTEQFTRATES